MREADVVGVRAGIKWRTGAIIVSVGLLFWFAQSMSSFAAREATRGYGPTNTHPEAIWPAFLFFVLVLGGGAMATWRSAERDLGDVDVRPWRLRLNMDGIFSVLGVLVAGFIGVIVIAGAIDIAKQPMTLTLGLILTPAAVWLLLWCPLVVIDARNRELRRWALGGWFPWVKRIAFGDIEQVNVRVLVRQGVPVSYVLQAKLKSGKLVPVDSLGGMAPPAEVEKVRSELEGRFKA